MWENDFNLSAEFNKIVSILQEIPVTAVVWSVCCVFANLAICILGLWRCFANNYLHWAATCTWLLLNLQGSLPCSYQFTTSPSRRQFFLSSIQVLSEKESVLLNVNILSGTFCSLSLCHMRCFLFPWNGAWLAELLLQSHTLSSQRSPSFRKHKWKIRALTRHVSSNKWLPTHCFTLRSTLLECTRNI